MLVRIFGPNLADQSKGDFHAHAADCGDCRKYDADLLGADLQDGAPALEIDSRADATTYIYPPEDFQYDAATEIGVYEDSIWFAPCLRGLR